MESKKNLGCFICFCYSNTPYWFALVRAKLPIFLGTHWASFLTTHKYQFWENSFNCCLYNSFLPFPVFLLLFEPGFTINYKGKLNPSPRWTEWIYLTQNRLESRVHRYRRFVAFPHWWKLFFSISFSYTSFICLHVLYSVLQTGYFLKDFEIY